MFWLNRLLCLLLAIHGLYSAYVPKSLPNLDMLTRVDVKGEVGGCLKHKHNSATETETAHLFCSRQRLAIEN